MLHEGFVFRATIDHLAQSFKLHTLLQPVSCWYWLKLLKLVPLLKDIFSLAQSGLVLVKSSMCQQNFAIIFTFGAGTFSMLKQPIITFTLDSITNGCEKTVCKSEIGTLVYKNLKWWAVLGIFANHTSPFKPSMRMFADKCLNFRKRSCWNTQAYLVGNWIEVESASRPILWIFSSAKFPWHL